MKIINEDDYTSVSVGLHGLVGVPVKNKKSKSIFDIESRIYLKSIQNSKAIRFNYYKLITRF